MFWKELGYGSFQRGLSAAVIETQDINSEWISLQEVHVTVMLAHAYITFVFPSTQKKKYFASNIIMNLSSKL